MSMRLYFIFFASTVVLAGLWLLLPWTAIQHWAAAEQRAFQNAMAHALRRIQAGDPLAVWALCAATAAYGFVHALGPGHGKVLIGGAALASGVSMRRLGILTLLSSLAQAGTAILLVGGLVFLFQIGSKDLVGLTETWLAPASYAAIAAIGAVLIVRGGRSWARMGKRHHHHEACGCGHAHGPSIEQVHTLSSRRDALALIASIAIRPCTGALFVLVIAARFDAFWTGALAVMAMGLGTTSFNLLVAGTGVVARSLAGFGAGHDQGVQALSAGLHIIGGSLIAILSIAMLLPYF
jgi:ABC-type nickel/cobalt efflux system permease component RcnA